MKASLALAAATIAIAGTASAASFSFTGNLASDDDRVGFGFTVGAASTVTLRSYSYAGGTMLDGTIVAAGGFDPILSLFDATGTLIDTVDDGPEPVPADPVTGARFDTHFVEALAPGDYQVFVSQFNNFANGPTLSDGFLYDGAPTFTSTFLCSNGRFCDVTGDNRTSFFAFDIDGVETAVVTDPPGVVPLPAGLPLLLAGLGGLAVLRRRQRA